jgi:signal transduction histidine kinase
MSALPLRRVLIVDDSPEDREVYKRFLRADTSHRWEFREADSGEQGQQLCRKQPPDCLLLDYRLPDVDGVSFLAELGCEEDGVAVPVIVLTGQGSEAIAVDAMKSGAQDYLLKATITAASLQRAVDHAIDKVSLLRRIRRRTEELAAANTELEREVAQRTKAEQALQRAHEELEQLVAARTEELSRANRELSNEIAERRRIEEERAQLLVREQQANRLKDEFLATISHELRTPLNAVLGWARVLRSTDLPAGLRTRALESIERNAAAQARLIDDLLEVSRIVTGKLRLRVRPVDLAQIVDAAVDVVRAAADAREIQLERRYARRPWPTLGDPDRLQQVAWNLLSNAVKFTPPGGTVRVEIDRAGSMDRLVVRDTGKGIEPEFLPHVFAPFRQADASTTRDHGGLGIGLAIVRQLTELHGGSVSAQSDGSDRGATFTVLLPVHEGVASGRPGPQTSGAADAQLPDLSRTRVLVVDDDADARELLTATLGYYGAEVVTAENAGEALALIPEVRPDVLLSDIGMSGEDGFALIRRVRALPADRGGVVPAVALTAYAAANDRARSLAAGFQMHMPKPFDPLELARLVQRLMEGATRP